MKILPQRPGLAVLASRGLALGRLAFACAGAGGLLAIPLAAAEPAAPASISPAGQRRFGSSEEAVKALEAAAAAQDRMALQAIFGPEFPGLATGDAVLDSNHAKRFAAALAESCLAVPDGAERVNLTIGTNAWPMPIPLVKADGQWFFDTAAGREEIINRHIGKDELHAIGVCRAYVTAQRDYARRRPDAGGNGEFALRFKSTPGKQDGLFWPVAAGEAASPFGPLVAEAQAEGYHHRPGAGPQPFHGYYFRILTRQGGAAPGGKINYLARGRLTGGFALVAYPQNWDRSGIMTFIVNGDGLLYQRNLGAATTRIAAAMKFYNPGAGWTLVPDAGVPGAVSER